MALHLLAWLHTLVVPSTYTPTSPFVELETVQCIGCPGSSEGVLWFSSSSCRRAKDQPYPCRGYGPGLANELVWNHGCYPHSACQVLDHLFIKLAAEIQGHNNNNDHRITSNTVVVQEQHMHERSSRRWRADQTCQSLSGAFIRGV